jgi:hypothetical protein
LIESPDEQAVRSPTGQLVSVLGLTFDDLVEGLPGRFTASPDIFHSCLPLALLGGETYNRLDGGLGKWDGILVKQCK